MNKLGIVLVILSICCAAKSQSKLEVEITNLKSNKGVVVMELFDGNHKSIFGKKGNIQNNKCVIVIDNLKPSKYAIRYIHDENSNDKLDLNWIGIPLEGYGFSNNAYGNFGPKPFKDWLFEVRDNTRITMKTKN